MNKRQCKFCCWSHKDDLNTALECRFDPPSVFPVQQKNKISGQMMGTAISLYPPVNKDHYCSHFKGKIQ